MNNIEVKKENSIPNKSLYLMWNQSLGDQWPISESQFGKVIRNSYIYTARDTENNLLAFLVYRIDKSKNLAQLVIVVVLPKHQKKDVGSKLIANLTKDLKDLGINKLKLGTGAGSYFWPGIPHNLTPAKNFFEDSQFTLDEEAVDLIQNISDFSDYQEILDRPMKKGIKLSTLSKKLVEELLKFEEVNFLEWHSYFIDKIEKEELEDILIAIDSKEKIVGSMILLGKDDIKWNLCFDGLIGGFGVLGVSKEVRGQGIGLAMSVKATKILKKRGFKYSFLGWTYLTDWYGKIGYKVWRTYAVGEKML